MKIIDIAICVNNIDPKGIGRIRCIRYNDYVGEKEKAFKYEEWDDLDPFVASPFLPSNINLIPEIGQSVKIINYNTDKETVNQEYISGPFTTMYDYNSQSFSQQIENTSYGVVVKRKSNIRNNTGEYIEKNSQFVFSKEKDYGIYGKYGSDVIFTENGIVIRGGKLVSKDAASANTRKKLVNTPIYSNKLSKLHLKKYPKTARLVPNTRIVEKFDNSAINYIVEYELNNLSAPTKIDFFVYRVNNSLGGIYNTDVFNDNSFLVYTNENNSPLKLINEDNSFTGATYSINLDVIDNKELFAKNIAAEIRDLIYRLDQKGLSDLNDNYTSGKMHPLYFRSSENFKIMTGTTEDLNFKTTIINNVNVRRIGPSNGLLWSLLAAQQRPKEITINEKVLQIDENSLEQTFASLSGDKIFFLSTNTNETDKKIDFESLDKYELTQKNYLEDIEPKTYSLVRGEELVEVLKIIKDLFESHIHNINKPLAKNDPNFIKLQEKINNIENIVLNKSIRIN
jgi:hypothetical protein